MNGYERVVAALELREPDQIPLMEWGVHPSIIESLCPGADGFDFVEQMGLDGMAVTGGHVPGHTTSNKQLYIDRWGGEMGAIGRVIHAHRRVVQVVGRPRGV